MPTITLNIPDTTFVSSAQPNNNFSYYPLLYTGTDPSFQNCIGFMQITLPSLPVSKVDSAFLKLAVVVKSGSTPSPVVINIITDPFNIVTVTYNTLPSFTAAAQVNITTSDLYTSVLIDVTSIVNDWLDGTFLNNGIALTNSDGATVVQFGTNVIVYEPYFPKLLLTYSETPPGPPAIQNLVDGNAPGSIRGIGAPTDYTMGNYAAAFGNSSAIGHYSHAEGISTKAEGEASHTEGYSTVASGAHCHAEGSVTTASGNQAHAQGNGTIASGDQSHAEGLATKAEGIASHAEGKNTQATANHAHSEGEATTAKGFEAHAEGYNTQANSWHAHSEGYSTEANGADSHAEGSITVASGDQSHAEGLTTKAEGIASHAEGNHTQATANYAHSEGEATIAKGFEAHAEGYNTQANSWHAHSEGYSTEANGADSHAEGSSTVANGDQSHVEGYETSDNGLRGCHVMGYSGGPAQGAQMKEFSWYLANNGLAAEILSTGEGHIQNAWTSGNMDYSEMFETVDGKAIDPGYFVTLQGGKIRIADKDDRFILGITSATPCFIGNSGELNWKNKYKRDEWGRLQYENITLPAVIDKDGNMIVPEHMINQAVLNPEYDSTRKYISRSQRPEWVVVGLMGQILVRDDGSCKENMYCMVNQGIATASDMGYRVMERTAANQIRILFK